MLAKVCKEPLLLTCALQRTNLLKFVEYIFSVPLVASSSISKIISIATANLLHMYPIHVLIIAWIATKKERDSSM